MSDHVIHLQLSRPAAEGLSKLLELIHDHQPWWVEDDHLQTAIAYDEVTEQLGTAGVVGAY